VIGNFVASWSLFGDSYLAGWAVALVLSLVGVWVVARDQVFLGAAVAQASTLGTAIAIWLQGVTAMHALGNDAVTFSFAVGASVVTALLSSRPQRLGYESPEAVIGWIFLLGSSVPVILLAQSPHGLEEVHRILFSSILGASRLDVWLFAILLLVSCVVLYFVRDRLTLFAMDAEMAAAVGMHPRRWQLGTALWLGTAVGLSIHSAGTIYVFGCLVLPALTARALCREVRSMFLVSPAIALATVVPAFVLAHDWDLPPAQLAVALMAGALAVGWGIRRLRQLGP